MPFRSKFPGVAHKILQGNSQEAGVGIVFHAILYAEVYAAIRTFVAKLGRDFRRQSAYVDSFTVHFGTSDARKIQQVIDKHFEASVDLVNQSAPNSVGQCVKMLKVNAGEVAERLKAAVC